jgi:hypothetical protein
MNLFGNAGNALLRIEPTTSRPATTVAKSVTLMVVFMDGIYPPAAAVASAKSVLLPLPILLSQPTQPPDKAHDGDD